MERNSRSSYNADFQQFSNFLRNPTRVTRETPQGNTSNGSASNNHSHGYNSRSLAMVYPEMQVWRSIYDPEIALMNGTIFEELNKPFYPTGCSRSSGCRGNTTTTGARGGCAL